METPLERIRKACVAVNPKIVSADKGFRNRAGTGWQYGYTDRDGISRHSEDVYETREQAYLAAVASGRFPSRTITLADVLLAIKPHITNSQHDQHVLETLVDGLWNLRADSLDQQSPETITFLDQLLSK